MGIINFLKGTYDGRVGATVGAKWKNKGIIRTYAIPANPNTPAQQTTRTGFAAISAFVALFADFIKRLTALDIRAMSVRNAIMSINKGMIASGTFDKTSLVISKGGLPNVSSFVPVVPAGLANITATWDKSNSPNLSEDAMLVVVAVDETNKVAFVGSALQTEETITIPGPVTASAALDVYWYMLDFRGNSKVASNNGYVAISAPAA